MKGDWEFDHVGLVVRDLDEVLAFYPAAGLGVNIGPLGNGAVWPVPGAPDEEPRPTTMTVYGKPPVDRPLPAGTAGTSMNKVIGNLQVGSLVVECIHGRPERHGMNDDFFRDHGDGISHVCYNVPDPEKETADLVAKGTGIVMSLERDGKIVENYLGTSPFGNIWLSFRPPAEKWHKAWQQHHRAHPLVNNWRFTGMGVAVRDLDRVVEYSRRLGIVTLRREVALDSTSYPGFRVHGLSGSAVKARVRMASVASVNYELVQTLEKETTFGECLGRRGDGAFSLDFIVDDLEKETARLSYRGHRVVLSAGQVRDRGNRALADGRAFAYFDARRVGNMMVKLVQGDRV